MKKNNIDFEIATRTLSILRERFPACFAPRQQGWRWPLKLKIHQDIASAAPDLVQDDISHALSLYIRHLYYQRMLTAGRSRIDLSGKPVGIVTEAEASTTPKPRPPAPKAEPTPPKPKRLSLGDLKAAAQQRRAAP